MAQAQLPIPQKVSQWFDNTPVSRLLKHRPYPQATELPKPRWHYLYYLLATFNLLTISASLYLSHQITTIYAQSAEVNRDWATRLQGYSELGQLAAAVNAPGNDVFDSHDPATESARLNAALQHFHQKVADTRRELSIHVDATQSSPLLKNLDALEQAVAVMVNEARLIFSDFRQNQPEMAGRRMATMDRQYSQVNQVLNHLRQNVSEIQQQAFTQQKQAIDGLKQYEVAIALMLLIMIVSVTAYGHRLAQQVQASQREREQAFQKLQQAEAFLREQTAQLEHSFNDLQAMQARLVESEKMSALGVMVAGVAHEINNPVNFIHGNLRHAQEYSQDLLDLIRLYRNQEQTQDPGLAFQIQQKLDEVDIDFLEKDLPKLFQSMQAGTNRIREIVKSLRNFSRLDEAEFKAANLHEGIDSTLMILHSRLKETPDFVGIRVIKDYGALPFVDCYPGQLNQVFMNILTNAIDALEDSFQSKMLNSEVNQTCLSALPTITIRTEVLPHNSIAIRIADNGPGIPASIQSKIFDPFFTTKSVGKGTGLGLSISYKIVVEKHGGRLQCHSQVGQGTEFVIEIPILQPESAPSPPAPSNTECNSRSVVQIRAS